MSQIDGGWNHRFSGMGSEPAEETAVANRQMFPATTSLSLLTEEVMDSSLMETMESMSLVMGSRIRQESGRKTGAKNSSDRLSDALMNWVPKVEGGALIELLSRFSDLGSAPGDLIEQMRQGGAPEGAMVLLLASLLADPRIEHKRRRRLEDAMAQLLEDEAIGIDMLAWVEMGDVAGDGLIPLRQIYQRIRQRDDESEPDRGLASWFDEIREWPDRRVRLRVLIRALALDLSADADHHPVKVVAAMSELKRLLLFFSMEDHCASVAFSAGIDPERLFAEMLFLLEQTWVYPDWLEQRIRMLNVREERIFVYLRQMRELLHFMPAPCFQDEEQAEQLLGAFEQLQEQYEEQSGS